MKTPPIKVFIADDHQMVIDGIRLLLESDDEIVCVGTANNGNEAIQKLQEIATDVVLLDINMPEKNGIETCKALRTTHPNLRIIAISMLNEISPIKMMLKQGAMGYLLKNAGKEELLKAIKSVHIGERYFSAEVNDIIMDNLSGSRKKKSNPFPSLSRREKEILQLIIDEKTTQEIAKQLFISVGTVETHRRNMMNKLGVRNTAGLVRVSFEYDLLK